MTLLQHCTTAKPKVECDFAGSVAAFGSSSTLARQTELFLGVRIAVEPRSREDYCYPNCIATKETNGGEVIVDWRKHRASFGDNRRVADISRRRCARGDGSLGVGGRHVLARAAGLSAGWEGVPHLGTGSVSIQPDALRGSTPPAPSDTNLGTAEMPFKTIGRAAELLEPGERVLVASGVYREWVRPARGGTDPEHIISYEAAPGAHVVVKGSEILRPKFEDSRPWAPDPVPGSPKTFVPGSIRMIRLPRSLFPGYNPFAICNYPTADEQAELEPANSFASRWRSFCFNTADLYIKTGSDCSRSHDSRNWRGVKGRTGSIPMGWWCI